jgi:methionyl-tRNA formyltransferase
MRLIFIGNDVGIFNSINARTDVQIMFVVSDSTQVLELANDSGLQITNLINLELLISKGVGVLERPEIGICASFRILDQIFLDFPLKGFFNIHPAGLPRFAGRYPFPRLIEEKESKSEATIHQMERKVDSGRIISTRKYLISPSDYYLDWQKNSSDAGAQLITEFLDLSLWESRNLSGVNLRNSEVSINLNSRSPRRDLTHYPSLSIYDAIRINSQVGGTALFKTNGEKVTIFRATSITNLSTEEFSYVVQNRGDHSFRLQCKGLVLAEVTLWHGNVSDGDELHRKKIE